MVLSDNEIRALVETEQLLTPFDEDRLQAVSYDISSGDVIVAYQVFNSSVDLRNNEQIRLATREVNISKGYHIKPGEYILVKTREKFHIPANLTAHVRPRTTFTKIGLLLSAQHMNPNFTGYLYLGLYNATPNIIDIYPDLTIGQMVFEEVCGSITESKLYDRKKDAQYQDEDQFISPRLDDLSEEDKRKVHAIVKDLMGA